MTGTASMHVPLHHVRAHPMPHIKLRAELTAGLMTWGESRKHICEMRFIVMINGNSFIFYLKNCFKLIVLHCSETGIMEKQKPTLSEYMVS